MYTIGFDFNDRLIQLGKLKFSVRLFTEKNVYAPDPDFLQIEENEKVRHYEQQGYHGLDISKKLWVKSF